MRRKSRIELNNLEIVTIVLFLAGGDIQHVHEEDVAIKCYELFPEKFSWKKYPQYPDKMTPLFALEAGRKSENGGIIEGNTRTGFILTSRGLEWLEKNNSKVDVLRISAEGKDNSGLGEISPGSRARGSVIRNKEQSLQEFRNTAAFKKFITGRQIEIDVYDFHRFMKINEYVPKRKYEERYQQVRVLTEKDDVLRDLVEFLNTKFKTSYQQSKG